MIETETFCTDGTPHDRRARLFQEKMDSLFSMDLAVHTSNKQPLHTSMLAYSSARLHFAAIRFSPHSTSFVRKPPQHTARLLVTLQKEGVATVAQDGRESRVNAGDIFVLDPTRPFHIETGEIRTHSVYLPRDRVRQLVPHIDDLTALTVSGQDGPGAMYRAVIDELFNMVPRLTDDTADRIADMIPSVLATALTALDRSDTMAQSRLKQFHRDRVGQYIQDHLSDPGLDVNMIATATNLSARYLYQLFDDEAVTLMKSVWNKRLENCRRELAAATLRKRTIGEIAYSWGFSDVAHFSRAFRERYAVSPRDFRKQAQMAEAGQGFDLF
nr:helix-turn-helix domain-containing protein [uncultured Duganella sp.]